MRPRKYVDGIRPPFDPDEVEGSPRSKKELGIALAVISLLFLAVIIYELVK